VRSGQSFGCFIHEASRRRRSKLSHPAICSLNVNCSEIHYDAFLALDVRWHQPKSNAACLARARQSFATVSQDHRPLANKYLAANNKKGLWATSYLLTNGANTL